MDIIKGPILDTQLETKIRVCVFTCIIGKLWHKYIIYLIVIDLLDRNHAIISIKQAQESHTKREIEVAYIYIHTQNKKSIRTIHLALEVSQ